MTTPVISIGQLALGVTLILAAGCVSLALKLGLVRSLLWGTTRTVLQLTLIGYVLVYLFRIDNPALIGGLVLLMCLIAAQTAKSRIGKAPFATYGISAAALAASTFFVTAFACGVVLRPDPWFSAGIAIPLAGLVLGNSLNGISLSAERYLNEVRQQSAVIELRLSLGYTPWEAVRPHVRIALRAGLTPALNALMIVGLVHFPGVLTGQILAGADPVLAARYQILVMILVTTAAAVGSLVALLLIYRKCFTEDDALLPPLVDR